MGMSEVGCEQLRNMCPPSSGGEAPGADAELDPARMVYSVLMPEADNPYGTSLFRSMEFVAQILLKIENATGQVWDRFGDPPYQLTYKTKNRALATTPGALTTRQRQLATDLAAVLSAKRKGNSADFVQAIHADDDIARSRSTGSPNVFFSRVWKWSSR